MSEDWRICQQRTQIIYLQHTSLEFSWNKALFYNLDISPTDTRETGFVNAITSAGVTYSITRACTAGSLLECSCEKVKPQDSAHSLKCLLLFKITMSWIVTAKVTQENNWRSAMHAMQGHWYSDVCCIPCLWMDISRFRSKKKWMGCVNDDMSKKGVSSGWRLIDKLKKNTCCA